MQNIGIIETGAGNLTSLEAAVARIGLTPRRLKQPTLDGIDQLIIPGQGRFGPVMKTLSNAGWLDVLKGWFIREKPLLGICVGLQVLFEASEEDSNIAGLSILPGVVRRLQSPKQPMMGWAPVRFNKALQTLNGDAYFVNSFVVTESDNAIAYTDYGQRFVAALRVGSWTACQFHPEKSGAYGERLLRQWLRSETVA
ncbi:imidazole glycerol phosphate synthase subunit HisH [Permianibacter aggregans]|uniref:Imidazole glycerol phosphate synthase subunit HisH n=1 Tax=Permianibacter aggregans TaxID=1510150 RepID=A0A4R6UIC3_9GAMM|nr:imidazole glycerol phosphate synthase subunit HisH [Permianibacter aggregans]TDQ45806.1 imidazole glycerol phosphate synthase subunit HisH [Permianibacter aggregans]